jgi:hypothetical protein
MGLYINGQMIMDPIYGPILYTCGLSNAFKLKCGYNSKLYLVQINIATEKEITEYVIRPVKVIPTSQVKASFAQLGMIIHILCKFLKRVAERMVRRMVDKRMILALM